jgi:hypothetical protein
MPTDNFKDYGTNFQTPPIICEYMASFLPDNAGMILEPTPGLGNLVKVLESKGIVVSPPQGVDFLQWNYSAKFDWICMNPPHSPMTLGYKMLYKSMEMTDNIIALMPWLCLINGDKRTKDIFNFGLKSITHLPRTSFKGSRVQTCILEMKKGYLGSTIYRMLPEKYNDFNR